MMVAPMTMVVDVMARVFKILGSFCFLVMDSVRMDVIGTKLL